jgi:hypothetical protein
MAGKVTKESVGSKLFGFYQFNVGFFTMTHWMPGESADRDPMSQFLHVKLRKMEVK